VRNFATQQLPRRVLASRSFTTCADHDPQQRGQQLLVASRISRKRPVFQMWRQRKVDMQAHFRDGIARVTTWAAAIGAKLKLAPPLDDVAIAARCSRLRCVPPSYAAFLRVCGATQVLAPLDRPVGEWRTVQGVFRILGDDGIERVMADMIANPPVVATVDDRGAISLEHLVAFAEEEAYDECAWCFDTSGAGPELPVVRFHLGTAHAFARYRAGGERVMPAQQRSYNDFAGWFDAEVACTVRLPKSRVIW
jgi:hypothetical protein